VSTIIGAFATRSGERKERAPTYIVNMNCVVSRTFTLKAMIAPERGFRRYTFHSLDRQAGAHREQLIDKSCKAQKMRHYGNLDIFCRALST
jgi:hypothetical protein